MCTKAHNSYVNFKSKAWGVCHLKLFKNQKTVKHLFIIKLSIFCIKLNLQCGDETYTIASFLNLKRYSQQRLNQTKNN